MSEGNNYFYNLADEIDELVGIKKTDSDNVKRAVDIANSSSGLMRYFISTLIQNDQISWFPNLQSLGFFQEIYKISSDNTNLFPVLNKLDYIKICENRYPAEVLSLIEKIQPDNQFVFNWLVRFVAEKESQRILNYINIIMRWSFSGVVIESNEYLQIIKKLEESGDWGGAQKLLRCFLSPRVNQDIESKTGFRRVINDSIASNYLIKLALSTILGAYISKYPESLLDIGITCLRKRSDLEDEIAWWRSSIEESDQNISDTYGDYLVVIIRDALLNLINSNALIAEVKIHELLSYDKNIYLRIVIYAFSKTHNNFPQLTLNLYEDSSLLSNTRCHHEYWHFVKNSFSKQTQVVQQEFLESLFKNFNCDKDKYHLLRWLWAVKDSLEGKYKKSYLKLLDSLEEPDHPDYLAYHQSLGGPLSPVDKEDLLLMTEEDVINVLKLDIPVESYGDVAKEGFAPVLQEAVKEDPEKFVLLSRYFNPTVITPMYVHYYYQGLRDAWKSGKDFSLNLVLDQIKELIRIQDEEILDDNSDTKWRSFSLDDLKRNILWFLSDLVRTQNKSLEKSIMKILSKFLLSHLITLNPAKMN